MATSVFTSVPILAVPSLLFAFLTSAKHRSDHFFELSMGTLSSFLSVNIWEPINIQRQSGVLQQFEFIDIEFCLSFCHLFTPYDKIFLQLPIIQFSFD